MKVCRVFRRLLIVSALTAVMFIAQACSGNPFSLEMRRTSNGDETTEVDTMVSEDLQLVGFDNEDWQSADDPIIP